MRHIIQAALIIALLLNIGCSKKSGPDRPKSPEIRTSQGSVTTPPGSMQIRELSAPARLEGTIKGDLSSLPAMLERLRKFGADIETRPIGPPVLRFTRLADMVDSVEPQTEVYLPAAVYDGIPEGGEDLAFVRTVLCRIVSRRVQGSLLHPLPELLELHQWAKTQGLEIEPTPGAILHTPEAPLDNQLIELFYPIRPETPLPSGTYSLCSPSLGSAE